MKYLVALIAAMFLTVAWETPAKADGCINCNGQFQFQSFVPVQRSFIVQQQAFVPVQRNVFVQQRAFVPVQRNVFVGQSAFVPNNVTVINNRGFGLFGGRQQIISAGGATVINNRGFGFFR